MADANYAVGGTAGFANSDGYAVQKKFVKTIDFSEAPHDATDVLTLFNIPAGAYFEHASVVVETPVGSGITVDVGDGTDPDGFVDGADANAAAGTRVLGAGALASGKFYAAASTLTLTVLGANATTGKLRVVAVFTDLT